MNEKNCITLILLIFILNLPIAYAEKGENIGIFSEINFGAESSIWKPDYQSGNSNNILSYDTKGATLYRISGAIGKNYFPFIEYSYEAPFSRTSTQNELLSEKKTEEYGLEKWTGGINLKPIVKTIITCDSIWSQ